MSEELAISVGEHMGQLAREGGFAEMEEIFGSELRAVVSAETVRVGFTGELSRIGPILAVGTPSTEPGAGGLVRTSVPLICERGNLTLIMSVDDAGMLHGLRLASPATSEWEAPEYASPRSFSEREVTVGSGALAVPGTLTVPRGRGSHPGVVLLHGGGLFDRDETSGANKPFKDLAWGLASRGIAVLRFDKVTYVHSQVASAPGFTAAEEYIPAAIAAARILQNTRGVDPRQVFVLGYSLGGRMAPSVAAADASVAGMVILAGDTSPLQKAVVRVARHIAAVSPESIPATAIAEIESQAARVDDPDLSSSTPASELPFNWSGSYWLDLREDDPVATAQHMDRPILILQGARDYQVTVADDLSGWQSGLGDRPDVTIRVYEFDDHLFFRGTGVSSPADYETPQHIDPEVVSDIADWLLRKTTSGAK